jgi:TPR repeat protein
MWPKDRSQWLATINFGYTPQMRALIATLTALMLFATTPVAAGDLKDGAAAYKAGDYQKAFQLLEPLGEQGNVKAQYLLGVLYANGKGVPKNDSKAVYWFTKAAKQGDVKAQLLVGGMYFQGTGVPEDYVLAYAWVNIAAAQGIADGKGLKENFVKIISPAQIAEGQKLSRELWDKYVVPFQKE